MSGTVVRCAGVVEDDTRNIGRRDLQSAVRPICIRIIAVSRQMCMHDISTDILRRAAVAYGAIRFRSRKSIIRHIRVRRVVGVAQSGQSGRRVARHGIGSTQSNVANLPVIHHNDSCAEVDSGKDFLIHRIVLRARRKHVVGGKITAIVRDAGHRQSIAASIGNKDRGICPGCD